MVTGSPTAETKKAIINALIHRVDILENGFKLGFYVGTGQIKKGEALASPSFLQQKKSLSAGSSLLFNGGNDPVSMISSGCKDFWLFVAK